jgi:hypothetical protein
MSYLEYLHEVKRSRDQYEKDQQLLKQLIMEINSRSTTDTEFVHKLHDFLKQYNGSNK